MVLPIAPAPEALADVAPVLTLCSTVVPMAFSQFLNPDHSIRRWLTAALPLVVAPEETPVVQPVPVTPVVKAKASKRRSPLSTSAALSGFLLIYCCLTIIIQD
ncbi:MAG: hypothetical protein WCA07_07985 [Gloeobacterales cyanobacterium]